MKKILLIVTIVFAFTACNKCQDFDCSNLGTNVTEEICSSDFDSNEDYNEAIAALELIGSDYK